ncbi:cytidylyltransferase family protein [Babesia divergens]|uniref:Cytidylyltransferase family protein n=1 Tax=Babesia divergens TaxID=32595 RepID=A0AAD9LEH7_BABDI|nr:cytidylyltransferase family protein [Babesia divergens]
MKEKVLLFAGTFDPITSGHILMLRQCVETEFFDHVWILPSGSRTDKTFNVSDDNRLKLCEIVAQELSKCHKGIKVSDYELRLGRTIDSYFTMRHFLDTYPEYEFYFFIGSDILPQIFSWPYSDELVSITSFLIADREGYSISHDDLMKLKRYELLSKLLERKSRILETSPTSSTLVRRQLADSVKCDEYGTLHPEVMKFITQNSLYVSDVKMANTKT